MDVQAPHQLAACAFAAVALLAFGYAMLWLILVELPLLLA